MAIKMLDGITRKIAPIFIALTFIGWIIFVAGFAIQNEKLLDNPYSNYKLNDSKLYAHWAGCVLGPIVCILAMVHCLLWGFPSAIVGSITAILSIIYISAIGFILVNSGIVIKLTDDEGAGSLHGLMTAFDLMFAGGFMTTFFWMFVLALWPWYKIDSEGQYHGV